MGILGRMSRLISSNLNAAIDKMSDPGKEIEQLILDMEEELKRAREEVKKTLGQEKLQRQKVEELGRSSADWEARAERAVQAGDDGLAREALKRKGDVETERVEAERALAEQSGYVDQLTESLKALEVRLREVKSNKETLKVKARASRGKSPLGPSAFNEFDRLSSKVDAVEAEASLDEELAATRHEDARSREVERKLDELDKGRELEDRLAALKAKMDKQ